MRIVKTCIWIHCKNLHYLSFGVLNALKSVLRSTKDFHSSVEWISKGKMNVPILWDWWEKISHYDPTYSISLFYVAKLKKNFSFSRLARSFVPILKSCTVCLKLNFWIKIQINGQIEEFMHSSTIYWPHSSWKFEIWIRVELRPIYQENGPLWRPR